MVVSIIQKVIVDLIFTLRRIIPKRIHRIIGREIKKKKILNLLFGLLYGIYLSRRSNNIIKLIPLTKKLLLPSILVYDLPSIDTYWEIFIEKSYEKYNDIKAGDTVLDIGANIGMFTIKAAKIAGDAGKIIAFEPEPKNIKLLKENTKNLKNVLIIPKAIGNISGKIELLVHPSSGAHFIVSDLNPDPEDKIIMVQIEKLDKIFEELDLDIVDFVKIDIEGWEMEALKGAVNSLKKIKFFSIASYHTENQKSEITELLKSNNFKVINDGEKTYAWNLKFIK